MMNFQFTHPWWLLALPVGLAWVVVWGLRSDVGLGPFRRWTVFGLRLVIVAAVILALSGIQWKRPIEGMNVFFLLDRSQSVPPAQQQLALDYANRVVERRQKEDRTGLIVFGTEPGIETTVNEIFQIERLHAVVDVERTDLAAAIRLGTAAFPENGQKRLVLLTDGNENVGDAMDAVLMARSLDVSVDAVPLGITRGGDVTVTKLGVPPALMKGQTFDVKIFAESDQRQEAQVRLFRNDQELGSQTVVLEPGKNLFSFPQTLVEPGFYDYDVRLDVAGDLVPQNNRAMNFVTVRGDPRVLIVADVPEENQALAAALQQADLAVAVAPLTGFPDTLAEMQSFDAIVLSNIAAGDLAVSQMRLLQSAVRDFGVGVVCVGGDQTYAAGAYRGTPLEELLPLDMELTSKKVLPSGALAMVMHGMEFNNGNQMARQIALGVLDALGPQDQLGVVLWDGKEDWLFPMTQVGNKSELGRLIAGMNQGDLPHFEGVMQMAFDGLKEAEANLKHIIVFSDGDPGAPSQALMQDIVGNRITVSSVLIAGHGGPETMRMMADVGGGRFYEVQSPAMLPQIFIKETAVILKSAINEGPFRPQPQGVTELIRGIDPSSYPTLYGYVATTSKPRAELPLLTEKGDPLLAHWQYGLGRTVAFTSDAKAQWARDWLGWPAYQQFWSQVLNWTLRRVDDANFTTEISVEDGVGAIAVEALDDQGDFRNFLNLQTVVVSPSGDRETIFLEQTGPGRYEARFATQEVGSYFLSLLDMEDGQVRGMQRLGASVNYSPELLTPPPTRCIRGLGASVNYSPEFAAGEPNRHLLQRLTEVGNGRILSSEDPTSDPFNHGRFPTFQPQDLWEWLLKLAIILFPLDVGIRRIYIDREEWLKATRNLRRWIFFWRPVPSDAASQPGMSTLLKRKGEVRSGLQRAATTKPVPRRDLLTPKTGDVEEPPSTEETGGKAKGPSQRAGSADATGDDQKKDSDGDDKDSGGGGVTGRLLAAKRRIRQDREL